LQVSVVQGLLSLQFRGVPGWHTPAWQVSAPLHWLPSEQLVPFATGVWVHVLALQASVVQGFPSLQSAAVMHCTQLGMGCPVQVPFRQASMFVQGLPSEQAVPSATGLCEQPPVAGLQESVVQGLLSLQLMGVPGLHTPV